MKEVQKAVLLLEDGTVFEGLAMGALGKAMGTVVFNTSMVGYQEALTTPANQGLLLTQTFPLVGNYGVNEAGWESDRVHAAGYIVREHCELPSNYRCKGTLQDFLEKHEVVGICGIDTRHLTKLIREKGEQRGMILSGEPFSKERCLTELKQLQPGAVKMPLSSRPSTDNAGSALLRAAVLDLGMTNSLAAAFVSREVRLDFFDAAATAAELLKGQPDGILLSDGPECLADRPALLETVRELCKSGIPILAVSLGHQLLAVANGMRLHPLRHGHRGANQPVYCEKTGRTYITTQNHVVVVDQASVDSSVCSVTFQNANDKTCEGLCYRDIPAWSVQFLPDAEAHTHSTAFVYLEFIEKMKEHRGRS